MSKYYESLVGQINRIKLLSKKYNNWLSYRISVYNTIESKVFDTEICSAFVIAESIVG